MIQMTGIRDQGSEPLGATKLSFSEDTSALHGKTPSASRPSRSAEAMPPRSHNSLLYDVTSANAPGHPARDGLRGRILLRAASHRRPTQRLSAFWLAKRLPAR